MGFSGAPGIIPPWVAGDENLLGETADLLTVVNTSLVAAGTIYLIKIPVRKPTLISNLWFALTVGGAGASSGSFAGLILPTGVVAAQSADVGAVFTGAAGKVVCPLTTPAVANGGSYVNWPWAAFVINLATTQPTLARGNGTVPVLNSNLGGAPNLRICVNGTGQVALPGSINPASNGTGGALPFWAGYS
jgi:hypothetical protein